MFANALCTIYCRYIKCTGSIHSFLDGAISYLQHGLADCSFEGLLHCAVLCIGRKEFNRLQRFAGSHVVPVQREGEV